MTEPESHTLAYLRRIDEKLDRVEDRLDGEPDATRVETPERHRADGCWLTAAIPA